MKIAIVVNIIIVILVLVGVFFLLGGTNMFKNGPKVQNQTTQTS